MNLKSKVICTFSMTYLLVYTYKESKFNDIDKNLSGKSIKEKKEKKICIYELIYIHSYSFEYQFQNKIF